MKKNFFTIHSNFSSSVEEGFFKNFPIEFYSDKSKYYSPMNDSLIREMYIILFYKQHRLMDKFPRDEQGYITIVFSANELSKLLRIGVSKAKNTIQRLEIMGLIKIKNENKGMYQVYLLKPEPIPKDMKEYYEKEIDEIKNAINRCGEILNTSDDDAKKSDARHNYFDLIGQLNDVYAKYIEELKK